MNTAAIESTGYKNLPLAMLDESSTNPRRTFEPSKLVELAQSISIRGLIQPITVRPKGERFEVVQSIPSVDQSIPPVFVSRVHLHRNPLAH